MHLFCTYMYNVMKMVMFSFFRLQLELMLNITASVNSGLVGCNISQLVLIPVQRDVIYHS